VCDKSVTRIGKANRMKMLPRKNGEKLITNTRKKKIILYVKNGQAGGLSSHCIFQIQIAISLLSGWNLWFSVPLATCRMPHAACCVLRGQPRNETAQMLTNLSQCQRYKYTCGSCVFLPMAPSLPPSDPLHPLALYSTTPRVGCLSLANSIFGICGTYGIHLLHYLYVFDENEIKLNFRHKFKVKFVVVIFHVYLCLCVCVRVCMCGAFPSAYR